MAVTECGVYAVVQLLDAARPFSRLRTAVQGAIYRNILYLVYD